MSSPGSAPIQPNLTQQPDTIGRRGPDADQRDWVTIAPRT